MNNQFFKIIVAAFITLAVIAAFPTVYDYFFSKKDDTNKNVSVNLSGFTKDSVSNVVIKKGNDEKKLAFGSDKWSVNGEEADTSKVEQLFQSMSDLDVKEMVSQNADNHGKFEVDAEKAIQLILTQNGKDTIFYVGKSGSTPNDFYLRRADIKNVYLVSGTLRDKLTWTADKWKPGAEEDKNASQSGTLPGANPNPLMDTK